MPCPEGPHELKKKLVALNVGRTCQLITTDAAGETAVTSAPTQTHKKKLKTSIWFEILSPASKQGNIYTASVDHSTVMQF